MTYGNRSGVNIAEPAMMPTPVVDYHDRVRWGPIFAGIVIALSTQLVLSALGVAIGMSVGADAQSDPNSIGLGVGIWSIISLFIALMLGSWIMARTCGPMNKNTALLNGAILWATTLALSSWLLASGVSGTFGIVMANAGEIADRVNVDPGAANLTPNEARNIADGVARAGWSFLFGSLLGLVASLIGATLGARSPRTVV
ncbi:hypothetical protein NG796_13750 [Laspinema sp. A4]|uniref:hypothetical protein n=1 Tax=Laspinema sp. D2d TaxID=2953686 RepID=UPI0021BA7D4D|nr:hypothetical protein [Laspinema sp. D2d]MCT7984363.1 hypothetical protein [Laspinema sp. D2d]